MMFTAQITVMPLKELLDPQGKAVHSSLHSLQLTTIQDVRVGKHITLQIEANNADEARAIAKQACDKMLHNVVMETYDITIL
jgi:phosphoribosylformylglycinamidine synthase subunit PurS